MTETHYQDMAEAIDDIAERIRAIGFIAPGSLGHYAEWSSIKEESGAPSAEDMVAQLVEDNETCARSLREAAIEAEKVEDIKTADLLTERVGQHEENIWMLKAMIS